MSTTSTEVGAGQEMPMFFSAENESLFGIVTKPREPNGCTVVLLQGSGHTSVHRNRLWVRLARKLAGLGYQVVRFDYHGVGDSSGVVDGYSLARPFRKDLLAVIEWASANGSEHFALVGSCFGARTALACASEIEHIEGIVLINSHVRDLKRAEEGPVQASREWRLRDYARRALRRRVFEGMLDPQKRQSYMAFLRIRLKRDVIRLRSHLEGTIEEAESGASRNFLLPLESVRRRGIPVLFLYGARDGCYTEFSSALHGRLGRLVADDATTIKALPHDLAGFQEIAGQNAVIDSVSDWLDDRVVLQRA